MKSRTTKSRHANPATFRRLTRADLTTFDREATDLVLRAMEAGLLGRLSSKGHVLLHNNTGGTAAVPRSMHAANRSSQNTQAAVRKLLAEHRRIDSLPGATHESRCPEQMTVAQAFVEHGAAFSRWFDQQPGGLAPDALLVVGFDAAGIASFAPGSAPSQQSVPAAERAQVRGTEPGPEDTRSQPEPEEHICTDCGADYGSASALGSHRRVHRGGRVTVSQVARANAIHRDVVRSRLRAAGAIGPDGYVEIIPESIERAGLAMPAPTVQQRAAALIRETREPAAPGAEGAVVDPASVLLRVREALGADPRVAELEGTVASLKEQLADQTRRAVDAETRLAMIQEAFNA